MSAGAPPVPPLVYSLAHPHARPARELAHLLGGKGANLADMVTQLHLPVPAGFVITTDACRAVLAGGWPETLDAQVAGALARLEVEAGRRLGDPDDPLVLSVRSGAPVSMPGMMDTVLDVGLNDRTVAGLARRYGDAAFARDCQRRLSSMYRAVVGVTSGEEVPDDPRVQLRSTIGAVFRSWNSERARVYRRTAGIPDDLGTAVVVQVMVFGNLGPDSATGVCFSRDPATGERVLYGDVLFGAQGEDVVAGTHATEPLAVLDERLPAVARELRALARRLEQHHRDLVEIEFTVEGGRLWILQVRVGTRSATAALRIARDMALEDDFPLTRAEAVARVAHLLDAPPTTVTAAGGPRAVTRGLPASPGVATGAVAVDAFDAVDMAADGAAVILVRPETSPADVAGMADAVGVLTTRGGLTSHAAVVARGVGIAAVVGATDVVVADDHIDVAGTRVAVGEPITIDGSTGEVFVGAVSGEQAAVPEVAELRAWASASASASASAEGSTTPG